MRRTVNPTRGGSRTDKEYRQYLGDIKTLVYHWISKMKGALIMMISIYIWSLGQTNPMDKIREPLPSKYSAQLFDCGVPGKIQLLQIPETCEERSEEGEKATLRETYVLSPRKLKKTSGVTCRATVFEFR